MAEYEIGFVWHPQLDPATQQDMRVVSPDLAKYEHARPSSGHPGYFNIGFCDGHVRSIDQNIDYRVYAQLMTPSGREAAYPGLQEGKRVGVDDAFRTHPLPEELQ
jgi:prepilin-type processing-associated H-X9-DG protein